MKGIFLLHGFLTSPKDYAPIIGRLEQMYDRVYCPLYPGHGQKKVKFKADELFELVEREFSAFLEECDTVDVMGFSMGGAIATYLAAKYEFRNLVLLAPANRYYNFAFLPRTLVYYLKALKKSVKYRRLKRKNGDCTPINRLRAEVRDVNKNKRISIYIGFTQVVPNWTVSNVRNFKRIIRRCNGAIDKIDKPTLILWGHFDQLVNIKSPDFIYGKVTNKRKRMYIFDSMSHLMLYSINSRMLIDAIISFLRDNDC